MNILFLCVANSARSQMAEGLARHLLGDKFKIFSAGSKPSVVNPMAIQVMKEIGVDISHQRSKSVEEINPAEIDWVVTLCAEEVCPVFPSRAKVIHWPLPDPAESVGSVAEQLDRFRLVRDDLQRRLHSGQNDAPFLSRILPSL